MRRHYYISDDLDDLELVEHELEVSGLESAQIHVLSEDSAALGQHHLNEVGSVINSDVLHSGFIGLAVGVVFAGVILFVAYSTGFSAEYTWVPAIFLSLFALGFCSWEGGLIGIQGPHHKFQRFADILREGKHVMLVDVRAQQEAVLQKIMGLHPGMQLAGDGEFVSAWAIEAQRQVRHFARWGP